GLKVGDIIIVGVDGRPASSLKVYNLRKRLRNEPAGLVVTFAIRRGDTQRLVTVKLRDLI
ncbi:MAG TPA: hypothetical protein VGK90_07330, partial [Rhizomicrobium sp.]